MPGDVSEDFEERIVGFSQDHVLEVLAWIPREEDFNLDEENLWQLANQYLWDIITGG